MAKQSKRLVVDASVARAASRLDADNHGIGAASRNFLQGMLTICHKVAMSRPIAKEWGLHQSVFSRTWRAGMVARKKLIPIDVAEDAGLRARVESSLQFPAQRASALKDCHLIETALAADSRIVSLDNTARSLFQTAAVQVAELGQIAWVDPHAADSVAWLKDGAPINDHVTL